MFARAHSLTQSSRPPPTWRSLVPASLPATASVAAAKCPRDPVEAGYIAGEDIVEHVKTDHPECRESLRERRLGTVRGRDDAPARSRQDERPYLSQCEPPLVAREPVTEHPRPCEQHQHLLISRTEGDIALQAVGQTTEEPSRLGPICKLDSAERRTRMNEPGVLQLAAGTHLSASRREHRRTGPAAIRPVGRGKRFTKAPSMAP